MTLDPDNLGSRVPEVSRGRIACILILAALFACGPFLTSRPLGSGEAYNYSLAVGDFVTQARHAGIPVFVGQTDYAFNGRIHPLRTAPYMMYAADLADVLTLRRLPFAALQNIVLASSIILGVAGMYLCLRRATQIGRLGSSLLSALYVLSPATLAPVYAMDLYMTVMTLPWVPLVLLAIIRSYQERRFSIYAMLAISLSAAWLAHPPVAFWLTAAALLSQLPPLLTGKLRWKAFGCLLGAGVIGVLLGGFAFVSAMTVQTYGQINAPTNAGPLLSEVSRVFASSLMPVSAQANTLGDFQLGYASWSVLLIAGFLSVKRRSLTAAILVLIALALLSLTVPVPLLTRWLWLHLPGAAATLTNVWPMQRLYLIINALAIFAFALVWPLFRGETARRNFAIFSSLLLLWTVYQAGHFIARGYRFRSDPVSARDMYLTENIDPTVISFAILGTPSWFINGVMDPRMECRLLSEFDEQEMASNWTAAEGTGKVIQTGAFTATPESVPEILVFKPKLRLEPGRRYLLTLDFKVPAAPMTLLMEGPHFHRHYALPESGSPRGFGMTEHNRHSVTLWNSGNGPEEIKLELNEPGIQALLGTLPFANFTLREIDLDKLPVNVESLAPFRARIHAAQPGYVEIPRNFIPGYAAEIDGAPSYVEASPDGLIMSPVPAGDSQIVIRYAGGSALIASFWIGFIAWILLALTLVPIGLDLLFPGLGLCQRFGGLVKRIRDQVRAHWGILLATAVLLLAAFIGWRQWNRYLAGVGPMEIRVRLDRKATGAGGIQPLVVSGKPGAGQFIYLKLLDDHHIVVGTDVWGMGGKESGTIEVDYSAQHIFVVTMGAFYPKNHPKLKGLDAAMLEKLDKTIRVELDGKVILDASIPTYPVKASGLCLGINPIGGSTAGVQFTGSIQAKRLPVEQGEALVK